MPKTITLVEDDPAIQANYVAALTRAGFAVTAYSDRPSAQRGLAAALSDLVIIDIGLGAEPDGGFALCRDLRAHAPRLPIIFLSARDSDLDVVSGFRVGADDFVAKDASFSQLLVRIHALFRRSELAGVAVDGAQLVVRGELVLDEARMLAEWRGQRLDLTVTEFWIIATLVRHAGHVKNRDQLMQDAEVDVDDCTITSHIKRIRKKFIALDAGFDGIETVYGMGYRWHSPNP